MKGNKIFNMAFDNAANTNNRQAIAMFRKLLEKTPDDIDVNYNLGLCYMNMSGNPDSALYFLNKTAQLDTDAWSCERSELFMAIGRSYQLAYKFDDALNTYDEIEKNDQSGEWTEAIKREREICSNAKILMANPVKLVINTLKGHVNTPYDDYCPVISFDQKTLIYTSRHKKNEPRYADGQYEELTYMSRFADGEWGKPEEITGLLPNGSQVKATCLTNNATELYIQAEGDIYVSVLDSASGKWTEAMLIEGNVNSEWEERFACVSEDGSELYFTSNRPGGFGGFDIYRSLRLPNGKWAEPRNLGDVINTPYDEMSPILHPTKNILYFSSNGHNTMGGQDIFYSIKNDDGTFDAVRNIGYPINTTADDTYFVPTAQKDMAYYASETFKNQGKYNGFDIYEVEYDEPEVDKMAIVTGQISHDDIGSVIIRAQGDGQDIGRFVPNQKTGKFVIIFEAGKSYSVTFDDGSQNISRDIDTKKEDSYKKSGMTIDLGVIDFRKPVTDYKFPIVSGNMPQMNKVSGNGVAEGNTASDKAATDNKTIYTASADNSLFRPGTEAADGSPIYTVQIMSLRKKLTTHNSVKHLDIEINNIFEYEYRDGWYVYTYGNYKSLSEANKIKNDIRNTTYFNDSFVRNIKQYDKFTK